MGKSKGNNGLELPLVVVYSFPLKSQGAIKAAYQAWAWLDNKMTVETAVYTSNGSDVVFINIYFLEI